jgi:hypothetical protein
VRAVTTGSGWRDSLERPHLGFGSIRYSVVEVSCPLPGTHGKKMGTLWVMLIETYRMSWLSRGGQGSAATEGGVVGQVTVVFVELNSPAV